MAARPSSSRAQHTRQAILDGAYRLIIKQGFAATSMRQIAQQSRVALGGIYNHFESKEAVFRAIIEDRHPLMQMLPALDRVEGDTTEAFVRNAARTMVEQLRKHPDFLNLMLIEIVEFKARHVPTIFRKFLPLAEPLGQKLAPASKTMRDIPPLVMTRAFLGMFFSYYITEVLLGRVMPSGMSQDAMDHFVEIFLHGILEAKTA
ncbi:MAG TPA: TetR/AcrR family transcriptional regulator [Anaerolineales bacterium]|nr:TetR/AcrR family transcriptional regulator [Anaerolineales bacterium]